MAIPSQEHRMTCVAKGRKERDSESGLYNDILDIGVRRGGNTLAVTWNNMQYGRE